jgi:hypothetical protein
LDDVTISVVSSKDEETIITRAPERALFRTYLDAGSYEVRVTTKDFGTQYEKIEIEKCKISMLPIYVGKPDWPILRLGAARIPFEPVFDRVALVFETPMWNSTQKLHEYLRALKNFGLVPDPTRNAVGANGAILYLKSEKGSPIFAPPGFAQPASPDLWEKLQGLFPAKDFGDFRLGLPLPSENSLARILDNRFLVQFRSDVSENEIAKSVGATTSPAIGLPNTWNFIFEDKFDYLANLCKVEELLMKGDIVSAEPDVIFELVDHGCANPVDPWFKCQRYIEWQRIDAAWGIAGAGGCGKPGVVVASIDSGVNQSTSNPHDDLAIGAVICRDLINPSQCGTVPFDSHGMGIYGIIGAAHNARGIAGIAPETTHVAIRRLTAFSAQTYAHTLRWVGGLTNVPPVASLKATPPLPPASVINCSHGLPEFPLPPVISKALAELADRGRNKRGVVVVYSSGEGAVGGEVQQHNAFALAHDYIVMVGNTTLAQCFKTGPEVHDPTAHFGPQIDICGFAGLPNGNFNGTSFSTGAPSLYIDNSDDGDVEQCEPLDPISENGVSTMSRTSGAAAMVSGVAALILSARPNLTRNQVRTILRSSAKKVDSTCFTVCSTSYLPYLSCSSSIGRWMVRTLFGWRAPLSPPPPSGYPRGLNHFSEWYGYGRLDAYEAVMMATTAPPRDSSIC